VPGSYGVQRGRPGFSLRENEIEVGLGIHGEQGVRRMPIATAEELTKLVIDTIESDGRIKKEDRVALLVNGLGSTPPMELSIVARSAVAILEARGVVVERAWAGTFLSALDMPGFSLSVLQVDDAALDLIDAPTDAGAWPRGGAVNRNRVLPSNAASEQVVLDTRVTEAGDRLRETISRVANALIAAEPRLTELDSIAGDGDLGASMKRGAEAVLALPQYSFGDVAGGLVAWWRWRTRCERRSAAVPVRSMPPA
jgi:dihydroxyacetone kinase